MLYFANDGPGRCGVGITTPNSRGSIPLRSIVILCLDMFCLDIDKFIQIIYPLDKW